MKFEKKWVEALNSMEATEIVCFRAVCTAYIIKIISFDMQSFQLFHINLIVAFAFLQ